MYITHPTHGAGTRPNGTQPPTATRKTNLNAGQCVRQPGEGRGRNRQTPAPKKNGGEGGGARERPTATTPPANTTRDGQTPHPEGTEGGTPKGAQRDHPAKTGTTKPGTAAQRKKGRPKRTDTRHAKNKKEPATHPEREGTGGQGPQGPGQGQPATEKKKNTPRQPDQEGRGTAETRAQHPRPHSTTRPGKAGNKGGGLRGVDDGALGDGDVDEGLDGVVLGGRLCGGGGCWWEGGVGCGGWGVLALVRVWVRAVSLGFVSLRL